jgi:UDP-N-acetylmuramyl pentapeptide synthase
MAEERVFSFEKNEKINLAKKLLSLTKPGDFILLKGSREMKMEEILEFWQKEYPKNNPT